MILVWFFSFIKVAPIDLEGVVLHFFVEKRALPTQNH